MNQMLSHEISEQFRPGQPVFVAKHYLEDTDRGGNRLACLLKDVADMSQPQLAEAAQNHRVALAAAYGLFDPVRVQSKPFVFVEGVAVIPIHGLLINRCLWSYSFLTGYNYIRAMVEAALDDSDVQGIAYDVNTYGGTVAGCSETAAIMYAASKAQGGKPSVAIVDANCYSAGYYLSSAPDRIVCTPSGGAGSIGVVWPHMDLSGMMEKDGVKVTFVAAPEDGHKTDGNPYEPLSPDAAADARKRVDSMYDTFVSDVGTYRPKLGEQGARDTKARCFLAADALELGLIDAIQTPLEALNDFFNDEEDSDDEETAEMTVKPTETTAAAPAAPDQATLDAHAATARAAERTRVSAILNHPEAQGRQKQAQHLAMETDMTAEACGKLLAASAKEAAPAAPAATASADESKFVQTMNKDSHPNVKPNSDTGATVPGAGGGDAVSPSQRILASANKAGLSVVKPKVA